MTALLKLSKDGKDRVISQAKQILSEGGLIVFPSDTVYGLLVDATNEKAVEKLISFKNRAPGKAIAVFTPDLKILKQTVNVGNHEAMLNTLLPGPFTIVLPSKHTVSKKLESEKGTLGVRIPDYPFVRKLVSSFNKPVTATSANLGGRSPHYSIESLLNQLPKQKQELIDLIVDAGTLPRNKPSTVVDLSSDSMKLLRHGDIVFTDSQTFVTETPTQTKKTGEYIIRTLTKSEKSKPVVCILQGDLGVGKTVFVKGIAEHFGIENIVSPTFVVYYEYEIDVSRWSLVVGNYKKFVHVDLYNIQDEEEFEHLGLEDYLVDGTIMCIEWGEKLGDMYTKLAARANIVYIKMEYVNEKKRDIVVKS